MVNKLKELRSTGAEEGFTLIELMIVVVIIGILAAIAIPIFANQQKSAIIAGVKSDVKNTNTNVATALVKAPTAAEVRGNSGGANGTTGTVGATGSTLANAAATFKIVVSDTNTRISVSGNWNGYVIVGTNTQIKEDGPTPAQITAAAAAGAASNISATNEFGVIYGVANGKTVTVGG